MEIREIADVRKEKNFVANEIYDPGFTIQFTFLFYIERSILIQDSYLALKSYIYIS